jgi:hypothetical protein
MQRSSIPWIWLLLAAFVLLLPGTAGRLLLDVIGGVTLLLLLLPLLAAGTGFLAWRALRARLITCEVCGTTSFGTTACPGCGSPFPGQAGQGKKSPGASPGMELLEAGRATIDVEAVDVPPGADGER